MQCSECLLCWNQGVDLLHMWTSPLRENESSRHLHQWRLDALCVPNYVIKKGRHRGVRHGKTEAQKEHFIAHNARRRRIKNNFDGFHDRFQKDSYFVIRNSELVGPRSSALRWTSWHRKMSLIVHLLRSTRDKGKTGYSL